MANNNEVDNPFNDGSGKKKDEKKQPNYAELVPVGGDSQPNYADLVEVNKGLGGHVKDFTKKVAAGIASVPDIAIGIGDMYSGGRMGKAIEDSGIYTPGSGSDYWNDQVSINAKAQQQEFAAAEGIIDKTKVALTNPSMITNAIGESLAPMVAGGVVGRGVNVATGGKVGAAAAGAIGEGVVMAGSQAENIRQETEDGLLSNGQVGAAVATGVLGSAFGYLGGRIAQKLGFDDVDNMMANGVKAEAVQAAAQDIKLSSIPKSILFGAISEGILEELPQSVSEQALQNIALGKDWTEGLDDAIVMGTLAGMAMGGGINAATSTSRYLGQERGQDGDTSAQSNDNTGVPQLPFGGLQGDYIPADGKQTDAQGRPLYEYDQMSTDADNLLSQNNGYNPTQGSAPNTPDNPIAPTTPPLSRQMGINPEDGPLSGAAALAVDSGVTAAINAPITNDNGVQDNNAPLTTAAGLLNEKNDSTNIEGDTSNQRALGQANATTTTNDEPTSVGLSDGQRGIESGTANDVGFGETQGSISTTANNNADDSTGNSAKQQGESSQLSISNGNGSANPAGGKNNVNSGVGEPSQTAQGQSSGNNLNTIGNDTVLSGENEAAATSSSTIGTTAGDSQSRTVEPILGADGKNKWFASQDKANAFLDKKKLGNDYQVVQDGKRFEIQPKQVAPQSEQVAPTGGSKVAPTQSSSQLAELEQQLANEKSVIKKVRLRKQIAELQNGLADQAQSEVSLDQPRKATAENLSGEFKRMEQSTARVNAARQRMREANPEIFTAENDRVRETHGLTNARVTSIADEIETSGNYELSDREYDKIKNNPNYKIDYDARNFIGKVTAVKDPHSGEWVGNNEQTATDSKKVSSDQQKDIEQFITENKSAFPNNWQRDGQWSAQARAAVEKKLDEILPGDINPKEFQTQVDQAMEFAKKQYPTLEQQHEQNKHPVNKWQEEMNAALAKADPEHPLFKKLQASAKNGLKSVSDRAVALRQAREIEKKADAQKAEASPEFKVDSKDARKRVELLIDDAPTLNGLNNISSNFEGTYFKNLNEADREKVKAYHAEAVKRIESIQNSEVNKPGDLAKAGDRILAKNGNIYNLNSIDYNAQGGVSAVKVMLSQMANGSIVSSSYTQTLTLGEFSKMFGAVDLTPQADAPKAEPVINQEGLDFDSLSKPKRLSEFKKGLKAAIKNLKAKGYSVDSSDYSIRLEKDGYMPLSVGYKIDHDYEVIELNARGVRTSPISFADIERAGVEYNVYHRLLGMAEDYFVEGNLLNKEIEAKLENPKAKAEPSKNTLVSDDRAAELRARLKAKLSQLNSGIDPEIMAIGAELAVYHIERGARKFAALAKNIANDLDVSVDKIRPYLRSWYNGARDMMEDMGADIQGMDSAETVRAELAKLDNPQQNSGTTTGKTETVVTPSGRELEVQHKIVEADDLITSNTDTGAINPQYPQALQPRDRTTLKSVTQVNEIANKLNPKLLGDSASSTNGAPIVSQGGEVESGNGRTLAIRKAYQNGKADAYKAWLADQGYDVTNMKQPVLVRERTTSMDMAERIAFTQESNERDTLDMSPSEQAMSDATKVMDLLHLVQNGSFNNTANRDFVKAFLSTLSKNERGAMLDKDGVSLTQDGYRRLESALLAAAFNNAQLISDVVESKDSDIKSIGNALVEVAPQWAMVRKGVQDGVLVEGVNVEANLVEAVNMVRKARQQNLALSEMINQDDIFEGTIDQVTKDFISVFYGGDKLTKARSSQKVAEALKAYAQLAMTAKAAPNLFGDAPLTNEQILGQVNEQIRNKEQNSQQDIFSSQGNDDAGNGKSSQVGQGSAPSQPNAAASQSAAVTRPTVERPKNDVTLVQDWGVKYLDGYATNVQHQGKIQTDYGVKDGVKAAFLKDSKKYLEAVQKNLESIGYELHLNKKGKPEKVSVNESGVAGSGEVSLAIREPITGTNVWLKIGDGFPGSHPQRIGILYRASIKESDKYVSGMGKEQTGNQYAGANVSAFELAQMIDDMVTALVKRNKAQNNEQPTSSTPNTQGTQGVRSTGRTAQQNDSQANNSNVETGESAGSTTSTGTEAIGRSSVRGSATNVGNGGKSTGIRNESDGREGTSGTAELSTTQPTKLESPAAVKSGATDFHMADPDILLGGSQKQRFEKNKAALELLEELTNEGRQATPEEQFTLASYTGWGSFGQDLFQGTWDKPIVKDDWKEQNTWLREKLGEDAWRSAQSSILTAFFTDPYTVQSMWSMAEKMGFTGGRVLEPAIGTGNFVSLMPFHLKQRSQVTGIDLDITTASISKQLFPESNIQNMGYQKSKTPDNFYDLVISNVPFSNDVKIADRRYNQFNPNLHDYYFLKMLDQVRPGGIVMAITSSGTLDKQSEVIRREIAKKAELITAVRLPSGAFKEFAGTAVVTDIIVLRKRAEPLAMTPDENWIGVSEVKTSSKPVKVNSFYAENPRNVLGTIDYKGGDPRFAGMTVLGNGDKWLKDQLNNAAEFVPENALLPRLNDDHLTYYANKAGERTNTLTMSNGELMYVYGDQMVKATDLVEYKIKDAKKTAQRQKSIEDLIDLRKAYTDLTDAERINADNVEQLRKTLNKAYQAYTKAHGSLADSFGLQYFKKINDAYYYSLAALEVKGKPAEIFKRSTVRGAAALENPTVSDAFVLERNSSTAPSLAKIAKRANVSEDQARKELLEGGAVYVLPNGDVMPSDMYLSGNVRLKLEEAQNAVAEGNTDLQRNVDALKEIIPEDIPYFNIEAKMGATWVPLSDYEKYIAHMLGMTDTTGIKVTFPNGKWKVKLENNASRRTEATTNYGSKHKSFQTLVSAALSTQTLTVKYKDSDGSEHTDVEATEEVNEKVSKMKEDFAQWLWSDPERRIQLEKEYNHSFNAWASPKYDGSFMTMQGMALSLGNGPFNLRQHQQNAIWRAIVNRRSINAHEVGTGKTFTMGGIAIESRRYGIAKKPLILAHNANSAAVASEIQMMYPAARVLFIGEMGKAVRHVRMRQIANDDWDVVVMPHSMLEKLTLSEETLMAMAADDIAALESELAEALEEEGGATLDEVLAMDSDTVNKKMGFKNPTAKQLAKQRLKLMEDIQKQAMGSSKEDAINFEDLGVDMIMVDEVHEFKKPSIATRMNMKGFNTNSNKSSVNLQLLTRYVRRMNNGGNVHTFTGTPITNTLTEIYHQMRYVMEEEMQKLNVAAWDGWFGSFASEVTDIELSATGDYQLVTRLAGFVNVPELRKMIGQFMDIVFANDMPEMQPRKTKSGKILSDESLTEAEKAELLNGRTEGAKDRPYKKVINVTTEMSPAQDEKLKEIQSLAREWDSADGKKKRKWMQDGDARAPLSISTAAKKASYDARLSDPNMVGQEGIAPDFETSKASQVVKNVMEVYNSHPLASQVIFTDSGYNTSAERSTGQKDDKGKTIKQRVAIFSPVKDIVERLVAQGIPREQIAIVDGSVKAEARKAIADKVNSGEIRVVIGLTKTLGVGVNMQRNLRAMHHLDAPWMPGELEQRNGRGLRQGNQWNTVLEYRYITDKLDGKSWQVLAIKDRFINAFMKADTSVRSIEGDAAADNEDSAGDIMASFSEASGDPRVLQRIKMKGKLEKLQRKERLHSQGISDMKRTIANTQRRIERFNEQLAEYNDNDVLGRIETLMKKQGENFSVTVDGVNFDKHKAASEAIEQFIADHVRTGSKNIKLGKYGNADLSVSWDSLQPQATISLKIGPIEYHGHTLRGLESQLRGAGRELDKINQAKTQAQDTISSLSKAVDQPFGQATELERTQKQLNNIEQDLENNPVAPPIWLRRGAPMDTEVYYKGKLFIVAGHRYTNDGWFVTAEDAKGTIDIPYMQATDSVGMPVYEEREFESPNIEDKTAKEEVPKVAEDKQADEPLYRSDANNKKTGMTKDQVRQIVVDHFGEELISSLESQGKFNIIQSFSEVSDLDVNPSGYYLENNVTLIADASLSESAVIATFLHEFGHGGFQGLMDEKRYKKLMKQFEKLVEQGHPFAIEAQRLANREVNGRNKRLEMLPYLVTLSSQFEITSEAERGAISRFINDIISSIKVWFFDKFGVNLNLQPDDILELAYLMVDKASDPTVKMKAVGSRRLFSTKHGNAKTGKTTNQVRDALINRFGKDTIEALEKQGKLSIEQSYSEQGAEGFYHNGRVTLIADNLNDDSIVPTFLHELGGHAGFQNLMAKDKYADLMRQFDAMVKSGNPVAVAAKKLAERESDSETQQLEMLPYLLTLASTMQQTNVLQRNTLQRFIAKLVSNVKAWAFDKLGVKLNLSPDDMVALAERMVKQATTNDQVTSSDPDVLFSRRTDELQQMLKDIIGNMNKQGAKKLQQKAAFKFDDSLQYLLQGLGRRQLTEVYSKILPQLKKYNDTAAQMDADKNEAGANADELVVRWAKIKDEQQLAELMHEATLAKIDPDKPHVSGDSVIKYKQLRASFNALSPDAQKMYRDARDAYKKHHRDVLTAIKERIMRASMSSAKKAELMQQMDSNFFHSLKGVYFPLSRFGKYVVIVRKADGTVESVNRAETMNEAEALRNELVKMFPNSNVEKVIRDKAFNASRDMVGRGFMSNLFDSLDSFGLEASKQAELEDILGQLYLSSLPDLSWAKHGIHRKGTAGFSQDARRAFAQNMFHGASYLAKLRYADVMVQQLDAMQKHADERKNDAKYDQPTAQAVIDEMNKRHESLMSPDSHPLSSALTSLGFVYFLGLSVASGAVNMLQTVLVAYPQMGAKWGFDEAAKELGIAAGQSAKGLNDISKSLKGDELAAYNEAVRRGVIDVTQAHDLAGIAQGEDSGVMWKMRPIMRWASAIFHQAERFNREVTFVAAYRLAKKAGAQPADAFEQAMKATYDGHFDYSAGNRPRVMQGNVQKVIFLFKQFGQNMLYTMLRSLHQTFKGETPAARKEALKAFTGIMATHAVFAGTMGLPLIGTLLSIVSFASGLSIFGGSDDEPWDAETALKNNLSDAIGVTATDVLMNGISRATPWDISGRVGIDNLIVPQTREGLEGESAAQAYMTAAIGPIGGIVVNIMKGFQEIGEGHGMRGIETMSPTFMRGPLRAIRFADEGAQDKTGVSIKDDVSAAGIIGQALGFSPSDVRLATEGRSAVYDHQKKLDARRSSLMTQFARARLEDDADAEDDVWEEIKAFNMANPERRINKMQAMQSYRKRKKRIDTAENGMVISRKKRDDMDEGRFAFGED